MTNININNIKGIVEWKAPSNIALVKYWGKKGNQIPINPSLSLPLTTSYTQTIIEFSPKQGKEQIIDFTLDGRKNPLFANKIQRFLKNICPYMPFVTELDFKFISKNTFPHSSGIASSASGFAALSLGLCTIEKNISDIPIPDFSQKASLISRLGSGSASRSIYEDASLWGKTDLFCNKIPE